MLDCSCVPITCLLMLTLFHCSAEGQHLTQDKTEFMKSTVMESHGGPHGFVAKKAIRSLNNKLLFMGQLLRLENEVSETKRKRSFSGSNVPIDRLSISSMDPKSNKQRKLPKQKVTLPIDRIGVGRLPSTQG